MPYKLRSKPTALRILEFLNKRKKLTNKEKQHYLNLHRGYEGEILFDNFTEKLQCECLILNDLLLEVNNTSFQIDCLIITGDKTYLYEVKNYAGDYYYQNDKLFKKPRLEVINPLHQLSRSEPLLRQLLLPTGFNPQIDASVVFINPSFTLYQAPLDKPFIFPTQIKQHMRSINEMPSKLMEKHRKLADRLLSLHLSESPYNQLPSYEYGQLRKGIICFKCHSFSVSVKQRECVCQECGYKESLTSSVLRIVKEFEILFPNEKITTNNIHDWCQVVNSKKSIRRILSSNLTAVGSQQWTYYK